MTKLGRPRKLELADGSRWLFYGDERIAIMRETDFRGDPDVVGDEFINQWRKVKDGCQT